MSTPNTTRWIGIGLLGLPPYGALTFLSSIDHWPCEHAADGASGGGACSDKRSVDGVKRPAPILLRQGRWGQRPSRGCDDPARRTSVNCVMAKFTEYSFYVLRE
jgi:hypothetical protein